MPARSIIASPEGWHETWQGATNCGDSSLPADTAPGPRVPAYLDCPAMADAGVLPVSRTDRAMERLKTTAGVVAAVAGALTGMWTIYEKVRTDARQYTAASYETLAPQVNQLNEALRKL